MRAPTVNGTIGARRESEPDAPVPHRRVGCTLADRTQKSLPLVTKGRWHGEAVTEGIRSGEDRQPTIPQSACG